jgi:hypothetical protein
MGEEMKGDYTFISDGVCIIDCKTNSCDGDCKACAMYIEYMEWKKTDDERNKGKMAELIGFSHCELCGCVHGECSLCGEMVFDLPYGGAPETCPDCGATFEKE